MVKRCGDVGVAVYADVILNHMAGMESGAGYAGTGFKHFEYPGLYTFSDFHHCGRNGDDTIHDFSDRYELQNCALLNLADLNTASPAVQNKLSAYLLRLQRLGVKGFRIDSAKHMAATDINDILSRVPGSPYIVQELLLSPNDVVTADEYLPNGSVENFAYPYQVGRAFLNGQLDRLRQIGNDTWIPSAKAVVFLENHDLERKPDDPILSSFKNASLYRLGLVFLLTWPYGHPKIYSGYHFHSFDEGPPVGKDKRTLPVIWGHQCIAPWACQHRYREVEALVGFRNRTPFDIELVDWWTNGSTQIAYGLDKRGFVIINGDSQKLSANVKSELPPGTYCNLLARDWNPQSRNCRSPTIQVDSHGFVSAELLPFSALVLEVH